MNVSMGGEMKSTEEKLRIALQLLVAVMAWIAGMGWLSAILLVSILPWKPIYPALRMIAAAGGWMAQPVADKIIELRSRSQHTVSADNLEEMLKAG